MHRHLVAATFAMSVCAAVQPTRAARPAATPTPLPTTRQSVPGCPVPLELIRIPAGRVEMPTTRPGLKTETVDVQSVWISQTEITWDMWHPFWISLWRDDPRRPRRAVPTGKPYSDPSYGFGSEGYPVISVASNAPGEFCDWLSVNTGHKYRLPTEAEWEYACRAGRTTDTESRGELKKFAWFDDDSASADGDLVTHPVGTKLPNAWGLHDMLGNAAEWVSGYDGQPVLKGGSFMDEARNVTSRARVPYRKEWNLRDPRMPKNWWWLSDGPFAGFRVVRED